MSRSVAPQQFRTLLLGLFALLALLLATAGIYGVLALMLTRFLSSLLFNIRSTDPLTYVCVATLAMVTGLLA